MPNASNIQFNEIDLTFSVASLLKGINFVEGITKRGPISDPKDIIGNVDQFDRIFGGIISTDDFPLLCRRALEYGAQLRVNRITHYTDITDPDDSTAVKAAFNGVKVLTFDAALITGNSFDMTVNGDAIGPVAFASNSDTTMAAIAAAIEAHDDVADAIVVSVAAGTDNDRVILCFPANNATLTFAAAAVTGGASQAGVVVTSQIGVHNSSGTILFTLPLKYPGEDYNNLIVTIEAASNGNADSFNMTISHALESGLTETYTNLKIEGTPNVTESTYLKVVQESSQLVDVSYNDLSALTAPIRPYNAVYYLTGGDDGDAVVAVDYVGDQGAKTGFFAFDDYDDAFQICAPSVSDNTVHVGGGAYADGRKDLVYFAHLANTATTSTALITARETTNIDSNYVAFYAGGLRVINPKTGLEQNISELGDVLGIATRSDEDFGPWFSFAGKNRGKVRNALGVVNNFGSAGQFTLLNNLAQRQINMVILRDNLIQLNGNFTGQLSNSALSFLNSRRNLIYIKKGLRPLVAEFMEDPADIPTFKAIFRTVRPFLDDLRNRRGIFSYSWKGDQDISKIEDVVINNATDLGNGKYKARLFVKLIPSMNEMVIDIIITPTSVEFEDVA